MLFTSLDFAYFLILTLCLYYAPWFNRFQVPILILASFFFYGYHEPLLMLLLIISPAINIVSSYYIAHGTNDSSKKTIAITGISFELAILFFFKYSPLFSKTFLSSTSSLGYTLLMIPLPIGISFFTFEILRIQIRNTKPKMFIKFLKSWILRIPWRQAFFWRYVIKLICYHRRIVKY